MVTIDELDIQISTSVQKAKQEINSLTKALGKLSSLLKLDTSSLEKLEKINGNNFKKLGDGLHSFANAAKSLNGISSTNFAKIANGLDKIASLDASKMETLKNIDGNSFRGFGEGIKALSSGMKDLQNIKSSNFTTLSKGLENLSTLQAGNMEAVGNSLKPLAEGIKTINDVAFDNKNLQNMINSITRLANANLSGLANVDFTTLGNSIKEFSTILSNTDRVGQNTISMVNSIAKLAGTGANIEIVSTTLPNLKDRLTEFINAMSATPNVTTTTIAFTEALGTLANAGKNTESTANNLARLRQELTDFFNSMATVPNVSENTIRMTQALAQLASQGRNIGTSMSGLSSKLNQTNSSMGKLKSGASKATSQLKSMTRSILASMGIYVSLRTAINGVKKSIENSMNYIETLNYFNAAFGQVAENADLSSFKEMGYESADAYYKSFSERAKELTSKMTGFEISDTGKLSATGVASLGIDPNQLMNYQAMFGQMSSSMGIASETSLKMSQALTEIGADLASVKNMDFDKVWQDMASGLAGMSRTLDKYGVNIRNVNLQQKLNELGIEANITALNQNEKALLRTIILLDSTKYAWGDLSDTINQPANQLRLLKSNFINLSRTIGNIFLPIVSNVLPYINGLTIALQRLFTFIGELIGFDMDLSNLGGKGSNDIADDVLGNLQDDLDNATESAKELKNEVLGFDEVTKLSDTLDTEDTNIGLNNIDSILLDKAFDDALSEYQKKWDEAFAGMENSSNMIADKIEKTFKKISKAVSPTTEALKNFWDNGLKKLYEFQYDILVGFYENFLKPVGEWVIGNGLPDLLNCLNEIYNSINWKKILDNFNKFWKVIQPFAIGFGKGIIDFFKALTQIGAFALEAVGNAIGLVADALGIFSPNTLEALGYAMATLAAGFLAFKAGVAIANGILKIQAAISTLLAVISAHPIIAAATVIGTLVTAIVGFISAKNEVDDEPLEIIISDNVKEFSDRVDKAISSLESFKETSKNTLENVEVGYENALLTAQKYFELSQKDPSLFTEADLANLKSYKETLEEYGINMENSIDSVTNAWKGTNEELLKLIENQRNASKLQAYTDIMAEAQKQDIILRRNLQEAFNQFEDKDLLANLWSRYNLGQTKLSDKEIKRLAKQYGKTTDEIGSAMEAFNSLSKTYFAVSENQEYLNDLSEEYIQFQKDMGYVSEDVSNNMLKDTRDVLDGITTGIHASEGGIYVFADKVEKSVEDVTTKVEEFGERTGQVSQNIAGMDFSIDVNTDEGKAKIEELDKLFNETEKPRTTVVNANTTPATNAVSTGVSAMNIGLGLIKTPKINVNTSLATQGVNAAVSTMNSTLGHLTTPELELKTQKAVLAAETFAETVKKSLENISIKPVVEAGNLGFNIGLGLKTRTFATGGFPEDGWFRASKGEYFGQFDDGTSYIANNSQIEGGIAQAIAPAVYNAMVSAVQSTSNNNPPVIKVYVGNRELTDIAIEGINDRIRSSGTIPLNI